MITPYVKIDLLKVKENISTFVHSLRKYGISHRPHIKPHKSVELARLQLEYGAIGVTCATLTEVDVMAKGGVTNILLAIPLIGTDQWDRLSSIIRQYPNATIMTLVDSELGIKGLSEIGKRLNRRLPVLVAIDCGFHREGVQRDDAVNFTKKVDQDEWLELKGLFSYYGKMYDGEKEEQRKKARIDVTTLLEVKEKLKKEGIRIDILSGGNTVASTYPEEQKGLTESRAGNYIFYDMNAVHVGIVEPSQCALRVVAKVISLPMKGKATIDAGSKALSSDLAIKGNHYGYVVNNPSLHIVKLNEEHGFIEYDPELVTVNVGEFIEIIPNHACVVPNLYNRVFLFEGEKMIKAIEVDARGR